MGVVEHSLLQGLQVSGPDHPAILCSEETLTYGALADRVSRFADGLRDAGVAPDDRVALLMNDTPDLVAAHLAAMAAGAVTAAVSTRSSAGDLTQILALVGPAAVVVDAEFAEMSAAALAKSAPGARLLRRDRELQAWKARPAAPLRPVARDPADPAFWVMTSGTTGLPKAVEHSHASVGICAEYHRELLGVTPADRMFATSRLHFAYALCNLLGTLRLGATNIMLERWATAPAVAATMERFAPTIVLSVPSVYHRLLHEGLPQTPAFRAVRHYVSAGERLPPSIWIAWEAASVHPILDGLGCSEVVFMITGNRPDSYRPGSSGHPAPGVEMRIVDDDGVVITEPNRSGRLEVRMGSICLGYRDADNAKAAPPHRPPERFRPDGWFATGDEYMRDEGGFYHHRGRSGDMLRVSGIWISPTEIEDALIGIPSIAEAAAVLGEGPVGLAEIVLYVVPAPAVVPTPNADGAVATTAARERLAQVLPPHKLPRRFEAVSDLPRTATGKVQRHKLRDLLRRDQA
jgi:benzoate-CoA ligase